MLYYVKQQTYNGVTNTFNPNELDENCFYIDQTDLISECFTFTNGRYNRIDEFTVENNDGDQLIIGQVAQTHEAICLIELLFRKERNNNHLDNASQDDLDDLSGLVGTDNISKICDKFNLNERLLRVDFNKYGTIL